MVTMEPANKRQRIIDHGEVFTPPGLVHEMLELVADQCEREDARFLEPACGDGNFLVEVLRRRLLRTDQRYRIQRDWEPHALFGLSCLYGIEIQGDNIERCRARLLETFREHYESRYGEKSNPRVTESARVILRHNILHGDALMMKQASGNPLVLTEWALIGKGRFKRRLYEYRELPPTLTYESSSLFNQSPEQPRDEEGNPVFIAQHIRNMAAVHFLDLIEDGRCQ
jgi:hypothetical protein